MSESTFGSWSVIDQICPRTGTMERDIGFAMQIADVGKINEFRVAPRVPRTTLWATE